MHIIETYKYPGLGHRPLASLKAACLALLMGAPGLASFDPVAPALQPPKLLAAPAGGRAKGRKARARARRQAEAKRQAPAPRPQGEPGPPAPGDLAGLVSTIPQLPGDPRADRPKGQWLRGHHIRPGVDLRGADFTGARLGGMNFTGVSMAGARLFAAHTFGAVGLDLTGAERHPFFDEDGEAPVGSLKFLVTGPEEDGPVQAPRNPVGGPGPTLLWLEGTLPGVRILAPTGASYLWTSEDDNRMFALARDSQERLWVLGDRKVSLLELKRVLATTTGQAFKSGRMASDFTAIPNNFAAGPDGTVAVACPHRSRLYLKVRVTTRQRSVRSQDFQHPDLPAEARICVAPHAKGTAIVYAGPDGDHLHVMQPQAKVAAATTYRLPQGSRPRSLALGPDGRVWLTLSGRDELGAFDLATGQLLVMPLPDPGGSLREPYGLATGPDGNLWFTERQGGRIGRVTPKGDITEFALPPGHHPLEIAPACDGRMFFTLEGRSRIGSIRALPAAAKPPAPPAGEEGKSSGPPREPGGGWAFDPPRPRPEQARKPTDLERRELHALRRARAEARAALRLEAEAAERSAPQDPGKAEPGPGGHEAVKAETPACPWQRLAESSVNLPSRAVAHILDRHGHGRMAGKSQFDPRFSGRDQLAALIAEGLAGAGELARERVVNAQGYYFTHCTREGVGAYHRHGQLIPTSRFAVLTARYGTWPDWEYDVITAYPVADRE